MHMGISNAQFSINFSGISLLGIWNVHFSISLWGISNVQFCLYLSSVENRDGKIITKGRMEFDLFNGKDCPLSSGYKEVFLQNKSFINQLHSIKKRGIMQWSIFCHLRDLWLRCECQLLLDKVEISSSLDALVAVRRPFLLICCGYESMTRNPL